MAILKNIYACLIITIIISSFSTGCKTQTSYSSEKVSSPHNIADEFVSFVQQSTKNGKLVDIDLFITQHSLEQERFYKMVMKPLIDNNTIIANSSFSFKFNEIIQMVGCTHIDRLIGSLIVEYLVSPTLFPPGCSPEEFGVICDNVYSLNVMPGGVEKKSRFVMLILSSNKADFMSACVYLLDKKILVGEIAEVLRQNDNLVEKRINGETIWKRRGVTDLSIVIDGEGYIRGIGVW